MRATVLGASGHIGNGLVRALLKEGFDVQGACRTDAPNLHDLEGAAIHHTDITQPEALRTLLKGTELVFHAAVPYPLGPLASEAEAAAEGDLQRVLEEAETAGVETFFYVGSPVTGFPVRWPEQHSAYFSLKRRLEAVVRRFAKTSGMRIFTTCPTGCIGPYDAKPSQASVVKLFASGKIRAAPNLIVNLADTRDIAEAHLLILKNGAPGRYVIAGQRYRMDALLRTLIGSERKVVTVPRSDRLQPLAARLGQILERRIPRALQWEKLGAMATAILIIRACETLDTDQAVKDWGYQARPPQETLRATIDWMNQDPSHGTVPRL